MENETAKLIEQLASKLGTTAEYLWSVLLKQAHYSAVTDLIFVIGVFILGIGLLMLHFYFSKERITPDSMWKESLYDKHEEGLIYPMIFASVIWVVFFLFAICSIQNIVNGFLNPEYWALNQVLKLINS